MREVTAVADLGKGRAIIFGTDWNVSVSGVSSRELAEFKPGTLIDIVQPSDEATPERSE